jgi:hypothetical protein
MQHAAVLVLFLSLRFCLNRYHVSCAQYSNKYPENQRSSCKRLARLSVMIQLLQCYYCKLFFLLLRNSFRGTLPIFCNTRNPLFILCYSVTCSASSCDVSGLTENIHKWYRFTLVRSRGYLTGKSQHIWNARCKSDLL